MRRNGTYAWQKCPISGKTIADAELTNRILSLPAEGPPGLWLGPRRHELGSVVRSGSGNPGPTLDAPSADRRVAQGGVPAGVRET